MMVGVKRLRQCQMRTLDRQRLPATVKPVSPSLVEAAKSPKTGKDKPAAARPMIGSGRTPKMLRGYFLNERRHPHAARIGILAQR
jgi:hypothetical protein